jgi:hypothetical protein
MKSIYYGWSYSNIEEIHSLVEGDDDVFPTLRVNHRKLHNDKHRKTNMIVINVWNEMYGAKKNTIAIVVLCHIFSCAKVPSYTTNTVIKFA